MSLATVVVGIFGAFTMVGGIIGYVKAKSLDSLLVGDTSGVILLVCAFGMSHGSRAAAVVSLVMALALGGRFVGTWRRTHRVMPDLVMMILSLATLASVGVWLVAR